jgi:N-acetylneuraminic acid mutarotase
MGKHDHREVFETFCTMYSYQFMVRVLGGIMPRSHKLHRPNSALMSWVAAASLAACADEPTSTTYSVGSQPTVSAVASAGTWRTRAPMPTALNSHAAAVVPNASGIQILYVIGGTSSQGRQRRVYAYNPSTNTWNEKAPMPEARSDMNGAVTISGKIYVTGGFTSAGHSKSLLMYNPGNNTWTRKASMPNAVAYGVSAALDGKLYVLFADCIDCTGTLSNQVQQLWRYNPSTNAWTKLKSAPHKHPRGVGAVINGKWYVAGGANQSALDVYDPKTNTWTEPRCPRI